MRLWPNRSASLQASQFRIGVDAQASALFLCLVRCCRMSPIEPIPHTDKRSARAGLYRAGIVAAVVGVHIGAAVMLGRWAVATPPLPYVPAILVDLVAPEIPPPPPPPPPEKSSMTEGGGAPASTSAVRIPQPRPNPPPPEVTAPPTPTPDPPLVVGVAQEATPTPGMGQGGEGTGTGRGQGSGAGDGAGAGPRIVRGPTMGELRALHPREAFQRRLGGKVQLDCTLRADQRLTNCRVASETPQGLGFGQAGLAAAQYFRFRPGTRDGHPIDGANIRVGVEWP